MSEWERLRDIECRTPSQYGQSLETTVTGSEAFASIAKDVVRWRGEVYDVRSWRVYLAPWQPRPDIMDGISTAPALPYAKPTPWNTPPDNFDAFVGSAIYARVNWGSGGISNQAFVDWPPRGLLLQISGSYVQVDGIGQTLPDPTGVFNPRPKQMPILAGTLSDEPGGGDAAAPATYTYPRQSPPLGGLEAVWLFQVPPWARSFVPLLPALNVGVRIEVLSSPRDSLTGNAVIAEWVFTSIPAAIAALPQFPLPASSSAVRVTVDDSPDAATGCLFYLDL